ncbi:MAG: glutathione S-transferase family protein, partial [Delftia sp.]|nr:glutathione S-transferase family protein [Delftia sp.]
IPDRTLTAPCPAVVAYRDRCLARPAWQRTLAAYNARVEAA